MIPGKRNFDMPPRTFAIGDIHGCLQQFDALLDAIALTADDRLILLGDLIDRGPDSAGVLKRVRQLGKDRQVTVIQGNHEQMMLDARRSREHHSDWLINGGDATLKSYGGSRGGLRDVPADDWYLLSTLANYVEDDTHIFVHASAYADMPMNDQPDYMLRWERCENMRPHQSGKIVVCGHTPQKSGQPLNMGFGVCIDTHACGGGPLTCLETRSGRIWRAICNGRVERSQLSDYSEPQ
jgi:serine/threonine protein phosphatase 1